MVNEWLEKQRKQSSQNRTKIKEIKKELEEGKIADSKRLKYIEQLLLVLIENQIDSLLAKMDTN